MVVTWLKFKETVLYITVGASVMSMMVYIRVYISTCLDSLCNLKCNIMQLTFYPNAGYNHILYIYILELSTAGADPGFQVRGVHLKNCAERREARKILGHFVWKITILRQKIIFFSSPGHRPCELLSWVSVRPSVC
jgi:hypothetical protein